jgi:putative serine protease PepD
MDTASEAPRTTGRSRRPGWLIWAGLVAALLVGGVIGGAIVATNRSTAKPTRAAATESVCSATDVAEKNLPSVVTISVTKGATGGTGSGEVIRKDGYILTNNHVISLAAEGGEITVLFNDGKTAPAKLTGRDPKADLAVIKVDGMSSLPPIPFGSSKDVVVGQPVVALGAPLGLSNTVTSGIVSALNRTVQVPGDNGQTALLVSAVQTDAAINPGNSGGALVNCEGQLIGVPSAGAVAPSAGPGGGSTGSIGLGFAIPVDLAKAISDEIIATGTVTHAYFGVSVLTVPASMAMASGHEGGIYIQSVAPGGPAESAGLQAGDVITAIDGQPATSADQLAAVTIAKRPGDTITVDYVRAGQSKSTKLTLGAQP